MKQRTFIWLDDIRVPNKTYIASLKCNDCKVIWLDSYDSFVNHIEEYGLPDVISFDHDLGEFGESERNGFTAAKFLVNYCIDHDLPLPEYYCHSSNPIGKENILGLLNNFKKSYQW